MAKICCLLLPGEYQCFSSTQLIVLSLFSDIIWWQHSAIYHGFPSDFSRCGTASLEIWPSDAFQREDVFTMDPVGKSCAAEHYASVEPVTFILVLMSLQRPLFAMAGDRPTDSQIDLKWQTLKTCFLLAMPTACSRSFIHTLSVAHARHRLTPAILPWKTFCLSAAFWRSSGVFQRNYLCDLAPIDGAMATLGPVVGAQHVCGD